MTSPTPTTVTWRGVQLDGSVSAPYCLSDLKGWLDTPPSEFNNDPRGFIGASVSEIGFRRRTVTASGWTVSRTDRDSLLRTLMTQTAPVAGSLVTEPLTVTAAGRTLIADAQLTRAEPVQEAGSWGAGRFTWAVQWTCADPLLYSDWVTQTAAFPTPGPGVAYPVTYPVTYPAGSGSGPLVVLNDGDAPAPVSYTLLGPIDNPGVQLLESGAFITFALSLADNQTLTIDTREGAGFLMGEYRPPADGNLIRDLELQPGTNTVFALGSSPGGSPSVTATYRHAYWRG